MAQARGGLVLCWLGSSGRGKHAIGHSTRLADSARCPPAPRRPQPPPPSVRPSRGRILPSYIYLQTPRHNRFFVGMARTKVSCTFSFEITSSTPSLTTSTTANRSQVYRRLVVFWCFPHQNRPWLRPIEAHMCLSSRQGPP